MKRLETELKKRDEMIAAMIKQRRKAGRIPDDATHHLIFVIDTSMSMATPDVQRANGASMSSVLLCSVPLRWNYNLLQLRCLCQLNSSHRIHEHRRCQHDAYRLHQATDQKTARDQNLRLGHERHFLIVDWHALQDRIEDGVQDRIKVQTQAGTYD